MDLKLTGKRALVTGSTAGIGAEIARTLAREGALVAVNGRNPKRGQAVVDEILAAGGKAVLALGDVATDEGAEATFAAVAAGLGGEIDILVNNAAGFTGGSMLANPATLPPQDWIDTFAINIGPAVRLIQKYAPGMAARGWGRIISISSTAGSMPSGEQPGYGAAKAALENLSLSVAKHYARSGITSNVVTPGTTYTRSVKMWFRQIGEQQGWGDDEAKSEEFVTNHLHKQMVSRVGQPADIANAVTFLASPLADYINGTNLHVDGGAIPTMA